MTDEEGLIGPDDDCFHRLSDHWWEAETCWFSWNVPERRMGGWAYSLVRPTIGTCAGGVWVWDDSSPYPWELPYYAYYNLLRLPPERDLRDIVFPTGVGVKMIEPLTEYRITFRDEQRLDLDLRFRAVTGPHSFVTGQPPFTASSHFDQPGRVTGTMVLGDEDRDRAREKEESDGDLVAG